MAALHCKQLQRKAVSFQLLVLVCSLLTMPNAKSISKATFILQLVCSTNECKNKNCRQFLGAGEYEKPKRAGDDKKSAEPVSKLDVWRQ